MQRQASPRAEPSPGDSDVGRLFDALRPRDRALLWLAHVEGRDHREIGRLLGVRAISVRVLLFRARAELARRIRRAGHAPGGRTG